MSNILSTEILDVSDESEISSTKICLDLYKSSLDYHCKGKVPCIKSIQQYDKCIKIVREWLLSKKNN